MAITFGFYNSLNEDRQYNSEQLSKLFDGIIRDGVFANFGTSLVVEPGEGMAVNVGAGRAWFNHTWTDNDSLYPLTVEASEVILDRIDTVILEVNFSDAVRENGFKIIKGEPSSTPVSAELTNTDEVHQYPLCYISVKGGVTEILGTDLTNTIGLIEEVPFITGILETVTIEGINNILTAEWNIWFDDIKDTLNGDIAGNLLDLINHIFFLQSAEPESTKSQTLWFKVISESTLEV